MTAIHYWILPQVAWIKDSEILRMQQALTLATAECAVAWGKEAPSFSVASRVADIPDDANASPMTITPTIDQPQFLAYHSAFYGRPFSTVLADPAQMSLHDVECAASHEADEETVDPLCDQYDDLGNGDLIAREVSDPVEGDRVPFDLGSGDPVMMSSWVRPSWFSGGPGPYDRLGLCTLDRTIRPGGYAVIVTASGAVKQIGAGPAAYKLQSFQTPNGNKHAFRAAKRLAHAHAKAALLRAA